MESLTPFLVTNALFGTIMVALRLRSRRLRASVVAQENEITEAAIMGTPPQPGLQPGLQPGSASGPQPGPQPQAVGALDEADTKKDEGDPDSSAFIHIPSSKPDAFIHVPSSEPDAFIHVPPYNHVK